MRCTGTSDCSCDVTVSITSDASGTWSTSGPDLTFTAANGDSTTDGFCVKGRELHIMQVDQTMTMGTMGGAKITSDLVAVRQ